MRHDYDEDDYAEIDRWSLIAFTREVHCYGIDDGQHRRPLDPHYLEWPEYAHGHAIGMALPQVEEDADV